MKKSYIVVALALVVAAVGCRRSEQELPDRDNQTLALTVARADFDSEFAAEDSVNKMLQRAFASELNTPSGRETGGAPSRAGEAAFEANDSIGLYVHTTATLGTTGIHTPNICYASYDGASWTAEGYLSDILKSGTNYYATAYYPFVRRIIDPTKFIHSVAADQTTALALTRSDLMFSTPVAVANPSTAPAIALSFKHLLSKVVAAFTVPSLLDGAVVEGIDRVVIKSVDRSTSVSLADGALSSLSNKGDIKLFHAAGTIGIGEEVAFEGIVIPQTMAKGAKMIEIYFKTASGLKSYTYALDAELKLAKNIKHTFTLVSIGDLCFASTLDLTDGLAHTDVPLKIKSLPGIEWKLTSGAEWLKFSTAAGGEYAASIKGTGTGAEQTVYVSVTANTAMTGNFWEPRAAALSLEAKGAKSVYTARQNFYRFELETVTRKVDAAQSVVGVEGFGANQVWSAASGADWIKLASSVVYGDGDPSASYGPVNGSLESGTMFYQIEANNTDAVRTGTVVFTPTTVGGKGAAVTFEQAAGSVRVSTTKVMLSGAAAVGVEIFNVTVSPGLKWKILSATGVTTVPAVGAEQTGLGTPLGIKATWAANNTTEIISGSIVIAYGAYGAAQQRTIEITQAPEFIVVAGTRWATGNLVANGVSGARIGAPTDGGLYFQYGGLIGYKGGDKGDGSGFPTVTNGKYWDSADAFSSNDVAITPAGYTSGTTKWPFFENVAAGGFGYYYYNNFVTKYADFQSQANGKDVALGIGDPCAHYLGGAWRLPRYDEMAAITGSSVEGTWVPWSDPSVMGKWVRPSSSMPVDGAWFGQNSRSGSPAINTDLFIPASGHRNFSDGSFFWVGIHGYLWSSAVYDILSGFGLLIHESSGVIPRNVSYRARAFPIRCVQDEPYAPTPPSADDYIVMNGLKWAKGNLVARGTKNCEVGQPGDGGLYFQYGGLIGYKGGTGGDGRGIPNVADGKFWSGAAAFSSNDVKVTPTGYTTKMTTWPNFENKASGAYGYYYYNTFATKHSDFQTQANSRDVTLAIGDPCAYYLGDGWRLPKYNEISSFTGISATTYDAWYTWTAAGVTGKWSNAGPQSVKGAWFGPNSRTGTPTTNTDLFVPMSGLRRYDNGYFRFVDYGYLLSSSVNDATLAFFFTISESVGVRPYYPSERSHAVPVRCVSDIPPTPTPPIEAQTVSINGLKWAKGNLVANGANGAKVGAATDGGLCFQYGSLIGWTGGANGDGTGMPANGSPSVPALAIRVKPATYTGSTSWNAAWAGDAKNQNVANGMGDPCRYYLGSPWRLPTATDISSLYGNVPNSTTWANCPMGAWQASPAGSWAGVGAKTANATNSIFFPAAGSRDVNGVLNVVGSYGYIRSSVASDASNAYYLVFGAPEVMPNHKNLRAAGFNVRCVMDEPTVATPPTADQIVTVNGLKWTKGNLVANGGANCKVGQPGDGGLYFQYGGLVGYKGGAYGDGCGIVDAATHPDRKFWGGAVVYSANDVAVTPSAYTKPIDSYPFTTIASGGFGYYYFSTFATKFADFQTQANANNPALGIGDPCKHYLGGTWRLPKYNEFSAITGNTTEGAWIPWADGSITGKWYNSGPKSAKGAWLGPNSRTGTPTVNTDLFVPASGSRNGEGAIYNIGIRGCLWSSSIYDYHSGFDLTISESTGVYTRNAHYRAYGFPVRCVSN